MPAIKNGEPPQCSPELPRNCPNAEYQLQGSGRPPVLWQTSMPFHHTRRHYRGNESLPPLHQAIRIYAERQSWLLWPYIPFPHVSAEYLPPPPFLL